MAATPPPGTGYFTGPTDDPGPAVLVLHSALGLTSEVKAICDRLAELGYTTLAPDLADGAVAESEAEGWDLLQGLDMNVVASLIQSSARLLHNVSADPTKPIGVVGYSSGASWGLWLSARLAPLVGPVVSYYGTQTIDLTESAASYLCHFAEADDVVSDFEVADFGLRIKQADRPFRFEHHENVGHGFAEAGWSSFDGKAEAIAWRQTIEFLAEHLHVNEP